MAIAPFLAMTAAEMYGITDLPPKIAWMACHFSPYGLGLSNLPQKLPPGSLLMVDDITPPSQHNPDLIAEQLAACVKKLQCSGIVLDFQRVGYKKAQEIAKYVTRALTCPVAVSESYASGLDCPVFLSPVPHCVSVEEHLTTWKERDIWLELGLNGEVLTLTESGCDGISVVDLSEKTDGISDQTLHCHYTIETSERSARFTLWRTKDDLKKLAEEAQLWGVSCTIGLFQELR